MQRDVGAAPGVRGRGQVVGVGFASDFEDGDGDFFRDFRPTGEPFGFRPGLHNLLSVRIALVGLFLDRMFVIEHQQGMAQRLDGSGGAFGVVEQVDQRLDVVAAEHGAEQFSGAHPGNQRTFRFTLGHGSEEGGLDVSGLIDAGGHPVGDQLHQEIFLTLGRILEQFDQISRLLGAERQRGDAQGGAFGGVLAIVFEHGENPFGLVWLRWVDSRDAGKSNANYTGNEGKPGSSGAKAGIPEKTLSSSQTSQGVAPG